MKVINCAKCNEEYAIDLNKPEEWYCPYCDNLYSISTEKLSVEKLQEHLLPYKKETVQKIIDEKMQLVTADEFLKLHKESLTAIRENDELQEQRNTAKKHIEHVIGTIKHDGHLGTIQTDWILPYLEKTLAAIGGDDGQ
ncbi:MAG TPA: hypothetical protein DCW64_10485 [Lactococcus lactis]|nr:hypothetical protein [Lactococcus lactis]